MGNEDNPQIDQPNGISVVQAPDGTAVDSNTGAPVDSGLTQARPQKNGRAFEQDLAHQFYDERAQAQRQYEDSQKMYSESSQNARDVLQKATDRLTAMQQGPSNQEIALRYSAALMAPSRTNDSWEGLGRANSALADSLAERRKEQEAGLDKLTNFGTQSAQLGIDSAKLMQQQALSRMSNLSMREVAAGRAATTGLPWYIEQFGNGFQIAPGAQEALSEIDYTKQYWKVQKTQNPDGSTSFTYNGKLIGSTPGSAGAPGTNNMPSAGGAGSVQPPPGNPASTVAPNVSWGEGGQQAALAAVRAPNASVQYQPVPGNPKLTKLVVNNVPVATGPRDEIDQAMVAGVTTSLSAPAAQQPTPVSPQAAAKNPGGTAYHNAWTPPAVYTQYTPALAAKQYAPIYEQVAEEAFKDIKPPQPAPQESSTGQSSFNKDAYSADMKLAEATDKSMQADSLGAGNKLLIAQHMLDDVNSGNMHPGAIGQALLPIRSQLAALGILPPEAAASDEEFQKWARQLSSADLKNLFGGRVTNMELEQQIKSNPNGAMSPEGMKALLKLEIEKDTLNLHRAAMWNTYRSNYHGDARSFEGWYNKYWNPYDASKSRLGIMAANEIQMKQKQYAAQQAARGQSTAGAQSQTPVSNAVNAVRAIPAQTQAKIDAWRARQSQTQPQVAPNASP